MDNVDGYMSGPTAVRMQIGRVRSMLLVLLPLLLLFISVPLGAQEDAGAVPAVPAEPTAVDLQVYNQVNQALSAPDQRLPGSPGYQASLEAIAKALTDAHLSVHRQIYPTLVPHTSLLHLTLGGKDITGAHAIAPNGVALPTTWGKALTGPMVYLGGGSLTEMDGKPIAGSIAAIDFDSQNISEVFSQGARAVILVGKEGISQWQVAAHFTLLPMSMPVVWISRQDADAAGILASDGSIQASLEIASQWQEVQATNLWTKIEATDPLAVDKGVHPQAMLLSTTLDTFGAVPDLCPQIRGAANCALLSQVVADISRQKLRRSVYAVFFGSHFAAQDGARAFFYPVSKVVNKATDDAALAGRDKDLCAGGLTRTLAQKAMTADLSFLANTSDEGIDLLALAHNHVVGTEADDSYEINQVIQRAKDTQEAITALNGTEADESRDLQIKLASLHDREASIRAHKAIFNKLRRQMGNKKVDDPKDFQDLQAWLQSQLDARMALFTQLQSYNRSDQEIADALTKDHVDFEQFADHFDFDFANDWQSWMFCPFSKHSWTFSGAIADDFGKQRKAFKAAISSQASPQPWFPDESISYEYELLCLPHRQCLPISAAFGQGVPGFELMTLGDAQNEDELPVRVDCHLQKLVPVLDADLLAVIDSQDLPPEAGISPAIMSDRLVIGANATALVGLNAVDLAHGSDLVEGPARQAILLVSPLSGGPLPTEPEYQLNAMPFPFCRIDVTGHCYMQCIVEKAADLTKASCQVFGYSDVGAIERFTTNGGAAGDLAQLIFGTGGGAFTPFRPADYLTGASPSLLIARRDSSPHHVYGVCYAQREVFYFDATQPIKVIGDGLDILGITHAKPLGAGISIEPDDLLRMDITRASGEDLRQLNLDRLKLLRERNIINKPLEKLQADDQEEVESAAEQAQARQVSSSAAHATVSSILGNLIHDPLLDSSGDLINAVLILLILSIPFSFALERLLFGATSIYKQVGGFMGIFGATFITLYFTHPAFALAEAPIIIFLAFVITLLSGFTTYIMMGKFKYELKALQGLSSKTHGDQSEGGTAFAAIAIGISGMRNRPLKTFLTATTVALLTFTILVFASFSSTLAVVATPLGTGVGEHRIEFHQPSFMNIPGRLLTTIQALYGKRYDVQVRGASFDNPLHFGDDDTDVAFNPANLKTQKFQATLVVDPTEISHLDPLFAPLDVPAATNSATSTPVASAPPLLMGKTVADKLKLVVGDEVRMRGQIFRLAGTFLGKDLKHIESIDGTRIVPPDFTATFLANASHFDASGGASNAFKTMDVSNFVFTQADLVAITTPQGMANLGYERNLITLYPRPGMDVDIDADARDMAQWLDGPVSANSDRGSTRYFFTDAVEGSGFSEVLVPLLLGGLIIFSSLLGSIVDRQKEIFTFSALGLAPPDVAALFFAESAVFAVIGGMGGYLISQVVVKVLTILAGFGLATVPDVNFSSLWSILTILVVMATVILSTIYPARMAGRSANPGIARKWRMPEPEDDVLNFTFPFTVSAESIKGILAFIREHFQNHGDASLGSFAARDVAIISRPGLDGRTEVGISAEIALSPFDLGVFQSFVMLTKASDIPGIDEVVVELRRLNGAPNTWLRSNRAFIDDLREQFLRWRSLSIDTVEHYHRLAEAGAGDVHV